MLDKTIFAPELGSRRNLRSHWERSSILRHPRSTHHSIIILSDLHFPRHDSHPKYLLEFLKYNTCDVLIFLGDTHEGYDKKLKQFGEPHLRVWDLLEERKREGMVLIDIPGNHDSYKRSDKMLGHKILDTEYWPQLIVPTDQGRTLLFHGDSIDPPYRQKSDQKVYQIASKIIIGNKSIVDIYSALEYAANRVFKKTGWKANGNDTELSAANEAQAMGCTIVINGHTHNPSKIQPVKKQSDIQYGNTGSWVGGQGTAIVLDKDGKWKLIDWREERQKFMPSKPEGASFENACAHQRERSLEAFRLQEAFHSHHVRQIEVSAMRRVMEEVSKTKDRVVSMLRRAEDDLDESIRAMEAVTRIHPATPLIVPADEMRAFEPTL